MNVRGEGKAISNRKNRSDKKVRIYPYLETDLHRRLNLLSRACDVTEHELAAKIIETALANTGFINWLQDVYKVEKDSPFRIIPQVENGKVIY